MRHSDRLTDRHRCKPKVTKVRPFSLNNRRVDSTNFSNPGAPFPKFFATELHPPRLFLQRTTGTPLRLIKGRISHAPKAPVAAIDAVRAAVGVRAGAVVVLSCLQRRARVFRLRDYLLRGREGEGAEECGREEGEEDGSLHFVCLRVVCLLYESSGIRRIDQVRRVSLRESMFTSVWYI